MKWSSAARSVWGKISTEADSWLPLVDHLEDTAGVAAYLWDEFLSDAERRQLSDLSGLNAEQMRALAVWLAGIHDIGKVSPAFAAKASFSMPGLLDVMRDFGMDARPTQEDRHVPHATAGQIIVSRWLALQVPDSKKRARDTIASVIGCHHGSTPGASQLNLVDLHPAQVGSGVWDGVRDEILTRMAEATGATAHLSRWLERRLPLPAQVLLSGLVIMSDWIASNTEYFPYRDPSGLEAARSPAWRLERALALLDLPAAWAPEGHLLPVAQLLPARFPALATKSPRRLQADLVKLVSRTRRPGLFIVEGPMGGGKTEAALLAAEVLAGRFGLGGVFVGLPTMATANPMFERVLDWLKHASPQRSSIALAHGKAALNSSYSDLVRRPWRGAVYDDDEPSSVVVVNSWLRGRKRTGLANFVVGTIDQSLFAALKAKHVVLRHLGLAGKVVVIDEVHAADDYMREYLKVLLGWLGAYATPVILMSATLPPAHRDEFLRAYSGCEDLTAGVSDDYPRITAYAGEVHTCSSDPGSSPTHVTIHRLGDGLADLVGLLEGRLVDGGCAGVICNTVARAQEAFQALRAVFGDAVTLAHSRFVSPERAVKERQIVDMLGPGSQHRPHRLIVVGTQVLEQSLDVDFDVLVTDLAPADLLLQRVGRLHRHHREWRPVMVSVPEVWIRGVTDWNAVPAAVSGFRAVYGSARLLRAAAVIVDRDVLRLPEDIPRLVRLAYDAEAVAPTGWAEQWNAAEGREFIERSQAIERARTYLLDLPGQHECLNGLIDVRSEDPESGEARGKSQVRDGDDGLEVMALWRHDDGLHLPPGHAMAGRVISEGVQWGTSEDELARHMASCTLRLPATMCFPSIVGRVITDLESALDYSGWQESRWISGQLAVVFDSRGKCEVAGFHLAYDRELGLQFTAPKESQ